MSNSNFDLNNTLERALANLTGKASAFLIGSTSSFGNMPFHNELSDVDVLVIARCSALNEYENALQLTMNAAQVLNATDLQPVDVFFLNSEILPIHFSFLSALTGARDLHDKRAIIGPDSTFIFKPLSLNAKKLRQNVYRAEALRLSRSCQELFPVADTTWARQTSKDLLRVLKTIACATCPVEELYDIEDEALKTKDLFKLKKLIDKHIGPSLPLDRIIADALNNKQVQDWPSWMVAQEDIALWLKQTESFLTFDDPKQGRYHEAIARLRYLLFPGLRNILFEKDEDVKKEYIQKYADDTANVLVKLGLNGASSLLDLTTANTPKTVQHSYQILINHLEESQPSIECLAASLCLLEYALKESIHSID